MRFLRDPRHTRVLFLFALFQLMAPSAAAIADAWSLDRREAVVHAESESQHGCVAVHAQQCALCSVATSPTGVQPSPNDFAPAWVAKICVRTGTGVPVLASVTRAASQRAPPMDRG